MDDAMHEPRRLGLLLWPLTCMAILLVISSAVVRHFYVQGVTEGTMDMELAKAAIDAGIVGVAGALLALVAKEYEHQTDELQKEREALRAKFRYREELLKDTAKRITSSYNNTKRARRNMRALGLDRSKKPVLVDLKRWDECMVCVNDAQLEFEAIIIDVDANPSTYPSAPDFRPRLKGMERYLGILIREYERGRSKTGSATQIPLNELRLLSDFLGEVTGSRFKKEYAGAHSEARNAIREDLNHLTASQL